MKQDVAFFAMGLVALAGEKIMSTKIFSYLSCTGACLSYYLPEVLGRHLPETMPDVEWLADRCLRSVLFAGGSISLWQEDELLQLHRVRGDGEKISWWLLWALCSQPVHQELPSQFRAWKYVQIMSCHFISDCTVLATLALIYSALINIFLRYSPLATKKTILPRQILMVSCNQYICSLCHWTFCIISFKTSSEINGRSL